MLYAAAAMGCGPDVAASAAEGSEGGGSESSSTIDATTAPMPDDDSSTNDGTSTGVDDSTSAPESSGEEASTSSGSTTGAEPKDCFVPSEYTTIQSAIDDPLCATIHIDAGEYYENLVIERDVEINGAVEGETRLTGDPSLRLVTIGDATVVMRWMDLLGPDVPTEGCIANAGDLTLEHSVVRKWWKIGTEGAAIRSTGPLSLLDVVVTSNTIQGDARSGAPHLIGGADIYIEGAPLVVEASMLNHSASSVQSDGSEIRGASIWAVAADVRLSDVDAVSHADALFPSESLLRGGVIYVEDGSLAVTDSWLVSDPGTSAQHGGVIHALDSDVAIETSDLATYLDAYAGGDARGGVLHIEASQPVSVAIDRTWLRGKSYVHDDAPSSPRADGGAISASVRDGGELQLAITSSVFYDCSVRGPRGSGAALYIDAVDGSTATATIASSTAFDTHIVVDAEGGILGARADATSSVTLDLRDSILHALSGSACFLDNATLISNGHNLFSAPDSCASVMPGDLVGVDPLFAGVDGTLTPESPAIDAADPLCLHAAGDPLTIDYLGNPRPVGTACDIGAIEYQP
jgi:hypothetical protein